MDNANQSGHHPATFGPTDPNQNFNFCFFFAKNAFEEDVSPTRSVFVAALNIILAISAIVLNILVFIAVRRNNSLRLPSKLLLLSLILTDLGTGVITQPQFAAYLLTKANSPNISCMFRSFSGFAMKTFSAASLFMMAAISLDRYTAFFSHTKYREIVTTKRVSLVLASLWFYSILSASALFWNITTHHWSAILNVSLCLSTITVAYIKIYQGLHHHHGHQVQDQVQAQAAATALDVAKYRRTASSMLWIYGLFLLCYLPYFCYLILILYGRHDSLSDFTKTLLLLNSSLNPLVYCFRLPEIRAEVIRIVHKILRKNT